YTFPDGITLPPDGRILVVRDQAAFAARYPTAAPVAPGNYTGALNNAGEEVALATSDGTEILRVNYTGDVPGTDGDGFSLVRGPDRGWIAGAIEGGTPGTGEPSTPFPGNPFADEDGDGLCALLEFAAGTNDAAFTPLASILRVVRNPDGSIVATALLPSIPDGADIVLETSSDPAGGSWQAHPGLT